MFPYFLYCLIGSIYIHTERNKGKKPNTYHPTSQSAINVCFINETVKIH